MEEFDYIVVGSGAGGGPLAANLAKAGFVVLLLEAGDGPSRPEEKTKNLNYSIPAFHPFSTEDESMRWDYYVKHYSNPEKHSKHQYNPKENGVLYPRAATLGGCTAHHGMIMMYPHNIDWDVIACITGDASWSSENMRSYFEKLERCGYARLSSLLGKPRHGFKGWLWTIRPGSWFLLKKLIKNSLKSIRGFRGSLKDIWKFLRIGFSVTAVNWKPLSLWFDPSHWNVAKGSAKGWHPIILSTNRHKRVGPRDYLLNTVQECSDHLFIKTNALVTKVLLENTCAVGVEYIDGERLYHAHPNVNPSPPPVDQYVRIKARKEVILSAGTFNTPQLLMLSGIGHPDELTKHGIKVEVPLKGVGCNLQDRYEVSVVNKLTSPLTLDADCCYSIPLEGQTPGPCLSEWLKGKIGLYTSNGASFGIVAGSHNDGRTPDLHFLGIGRPFRGYFHGWSDPIRTDRDHFSWSILKGHTRNNAGRVTLRSGNARDVPEIHFHYFEEGNDSEGDDLESMLKGVKLARKMNLRAGGVFKEEVFPGADIKTDDEIRTFIKKEAWGHHACGTCKIGSKSDPMAVVDSNFRVYGTTNLRVVDASVFPKIPGLFIVMAIYMISEKASEVISKDGKSTQ